MNTQQQHNDPQNYESEIDLVDLIAVLWRRKWIVLGVTFLVAVVGLALFMPKNKSTTSTIVMIGETTKQVDGNQVLQQIMSTDESKLILNNAYIPEAIKSVTQGDDQLFTELSKSISVAAGDEISPSGNLVLTSSSITTEYTESMMDILNNATTKLLVLQNKTYENHQKKIQNRIVAKKLELKIQTDSRRIASEKLPLKRNQYEIEGKQIQLKNLIDPRRIELEKIQLKNDLFSHRQQLDKNVDKELLLQEELKHQKAFDSAKKKLNLTTRSLTREDAALKRHEELIPVLEERIKTLETELSSVEKTRASLYEQLGGDGSSSTLLTEALLAIDNRDSRYRSQIDTLNERLTVEFPQARVTIETRLETLSEQIVLEEQAVAIAKQNLEVFRVEKEYHTQVLFNSSENIETRLNWFDASLEVKKLDLEVDITTSSENLKTGFDSFDAFHEAEVLRLEADIVDLELSLEQSTPSEVIAPPTTMPSSKTSLKLVGIGALFVGGMLGCFAAFFLELLSQARIRAAETV
jgi:uncharacterized protein involved in exopolysaccharide biosynthesis